MVSLKWGHLGGGLKEVRCDLALGLGIQPEGSSAELGGVTLGVLQE